MAKLIIATAATKVAATPARGDCADPVPPVLLLLVVFVVVFPVAGCAFAAAWKLLKLRTELSTVLTALSKVSFVTYLGAEKYSQDHSLAAVVSLTTLDQCQHEVRVVCD